MTVALLALPPGVVPLHWRLSGAVVPAPDECFARKALVLIVHDLTIAVATDVSRCRCLGPPERLVLLAAGRNPMVAERLPAA